MERRHGVASMPRHVNAVYYPSWRAYRGELPSSIPNLDAVSHVLYAFASLDKHGTVKVGDPWVDREMPADGQQGCIRAVTSLRRRYPHLKVTLSVGGGGGGGGGSGGNEEDDDGAVGSRHFSAVAASATCRSQFARSTADLVREFDLDGVDVDWEHPHTPHDARNFVELLRVLRQHLPVDRGYEITAALPAGEWALAKLDLATLTDKLLDRIHLMSYDFFGPWTKSSGHHAQLFVSEEARNEAPSPCGHAAVQYLLGRGVHPGKVALGIPVYGRAFLGVDGAGQTCTGHGGEEGTFEYKELPRPRSTETSDLAIGAAYCIATQQATSASLDSESCFVSYDSPATVRVKARYAVAYRLAGLFYWTGTADRPDGERSLVRAGYEELRSAPPPPPPLR